jgi:hypothetical protein
MDNAKCAPGGTWYIAVTSYAGKGSYNLVSGLSFVSKELTINVTTEEHESDATIDSISDAMLRGMRELYGMTEGGFLVSTINVCNKPAGGSCPGTKHYVFKRSCNRSYASGGAVSMCEPQWTNPQVVAHEAGHAFLLLPDEYEDVAGSSKAQCGHTSMSMVRWWEHNICTSTVHKKDPLAGAPSMDPSIQPGWSVITGNGKVPSEMNKPWLVPDNYSYQNFDFNGYIQTSVTY